MIALFAIICVSEVGYFRIILEGGTTNILNPLKHPLNLLQPSLLACGSHIYKITFFFFFLA